MLRDPGVAFIDLEHMVYGDILQVNHFPCLLIYLKPAQQKLIVSTQLPQDVLLEDVAGHNDNAAWKKSDTVFHCPEIFQSQSWNHIVVAMLKPGFRGKAKVTLFVNGGVIGSQRVS